MTKAETVIQKIAVDVGDTLNHPLLPADQVKTIKTVKVDLSRALEARQNKLANKHFTEQHHPKKVKEVYRALKREHPEYSAGKKARIANYVGKK